jgi:hypothetical protein
MDRWMRKRDEKNQEYQMGTRKFLTSCLHLPVCGLILLHLREAETKQHSGYLSTGTAQWLYFGTCQSDVALMQ